MIVCKNCNLIFFLLRIAASNGGILFWSVIDMPATEELTGRELLRRLDILAKAEETRRRKERQPAKCRKCIWGEWTGTVQYCPKLKCVKE